MEPYFLKLNVETLNLIQTELKRFVMVVKLNKDLSHLNRKLISFKHSFNLFPCLSKLIKSRSKVDVPWSSFYVSGPAYKIPPHLDGTVENCLPVAINVPVLNCNNSKTFHIEVPENLKTVGNTGLDGDINSTAPKNIEYQILSEFCLDQITLIRTDIWHDVHNYDTYLNRINFVVRLGYPMPISESLKKPFSDFFDYTGLI